MQADVKCASSCTSSEEKHENYGPTSALLARGSKIGG